MATCFLFTQHFTSEYCLSLRLDEQGQIDAPLEQRTHDAFRALQFNARTIVVVPTESCSLHQIELPWLSEGKARAALPYALEEQIAQHVTTVHVAFDQYHYQNKQYLVVVIDKTFMQDLMTRLDEALLAFDAITLDWFALDADEVCVSETSMLVRDNVFNGALSVEPAGIYLRSRTSLSPVIVLNDSTPALKSLTISRGLSETCIINSSFYEWVAQRLFKARFMNLCQGELRHNTRQEMNARWYRASAILVGVWFVTFLAVNAFVLHQLTHKIADVDKQIAVIYHEFFPQARQVISPRFRVGQLLKEGRTGQDRALWQLEDTLATAIAQDGFTIEQLRYQNQTLSVTLIAADFAALDGLQLRLQHAGVKVKQAQASSHDQNVAATLELRL